MFFGLSEEALALREGVRDVLAGACPAGVVRASWTDDASSRALWETLGELGLLGLLVPEAAGGLGLDDLVAVAALEEAGYAGVPGPLVETVVVGAPLLAAAAHPALDDVLAGRARAAVQRSDPDGAVVPYASVAELVVQLQDGVRLLRRDAAKAEAVESVDGSRHAAVVRGTGTPLDVDPTIAVQRATLGTAAFLLGLARRQLDITVGYVKDRHQFGVPIGSFQAVKHPLADAVVGTEFAWPAVLRAAQSIGTDDPDLDVHVSMAKALASDAAYRVSRACLQAHGAMAYTVEYDLQLFAKRTWALARDWGTSTEHRAYIAAHLLEEQK